MKKIAVPAICAIALAVGLYRLAFLAIPEARAAFFAFAFVCAIAAFTISALRSGFSPFFFAALAVGTAIIPKSFTGTIYTLVATAGAALFIVIAANIFAVDVAPGDTRYRRWVLGAYCIEGFAICGALSTDSTIESVAMALGGILSLLILWRLAPAPSPEKSKEHEKRLQA